MATEVKETDVPTRTELLALLERFQKEAARLEGKEQTARRDHGYWQGSKESMVDAAEWLEELLDKHLPDGGNFDDMPF